MDEQVYRDLARLQSEHWWFRARREILNEVIKGLGLPRHARILELGCGTGGNLDMLGQYGRVSAMETEAGARAFAARLTGLDVKPGRLPYDIPFDERFDLVCLFDVLEHIANDLSAVRAVAGLLAPRGKLLVTVPAHSFLYGSHDRQMHHFRRYGRKRLAGVLKQAGLIPDRLTGFNTLLFPVALVTRMADKFLTGAGYGRQSAPGYAVPGPVLNDWLYRVFRLERHLIRYGNLPLGVSLLALAGFRLDRKGAPG